MAKNPPSKEVQILSGVRSVTRQLDLFSIKEVEENGIGMMGVLSDGTPYLTLAGLARMCDVDTTMLSRLTTDWAAEQAKPRGLKIKEYLLAHGHSGDVIQQKKVTGGVETHAYTDDICMAILEYYAFDATQGSREVPLRNFRFLARSSFRNFIYDQCGYDPNKSIPKSWQNYQDRIVLNDQIPIGYYSVFREIAELVIPMIRGGCPIDDHTVPDISVGKAWGEHWTANNFDKIHGTRIKHPHTYPSGFPQAKAGPVDAWIYPDSTLGGFRAWLRTTYVTQKLPNYIGKKVTDGIVLPTTAAKLLAAVTVRSVPAIGKTPNAVLPLKKFVK